MLFIKCDQDVQKLRGDQVDNIKCILHTVHSLVHLHLKYNMLKVNYKYFKYSI